jgi:hypothetical protein
MSHPAGRAARIISITFRRDTLDEVVNIYRTTSVPITVDGGGLVTLLGLINRSTGQSASLSIWETAADRERSGVSPANAENLMLYAPLMTGAFVRENYDATVLTLRPGPADGIARGVVSMTTLNFSPAGWEEGAAALRRFAAFATPEHPDCYGVVLLEQQTRPLAVFLAAASSSGTIALYDGPLRDHVHDARERGQLAGPPRHTTYEIMAWH